MTCPRPCRSCLRLALNSSRTIHAKRADHGGAFAFSYVLGRGRSRRQETRTAGGIRVDARWYCDQTRTHDLVVAGLLTELTAATAVGRRHRVQGLYAATPDRTATVYAGGVRVIDPDAALAGAKIELRIPPRWR
jgi:hypothetical protein